MEFKLETFFFDTPIYTTINIETPTDNEFKSLFYTSYARDIEGYNPWKKTHSTFEISETLHYYDNGIYKTGGFGKMILKCKRYEDEFIFHVYWDPTEKFIIKIGQYPSVADFHLGEVKQYKKVISQEKLKEFTRAIGLAANGIGIGSFVYFRRIFEYLIEEAFNEAKKDGTLKEDEFSKARMDEKIDLLHSYLPKFLVENRSLYSILSLGIHELDEITCLTHFETVKVGIEIILDEKIDELRKKEKIEAATKKISTLKQEIKK